MLDGIAGGPARWKMAAHELPIHRIEHDRRRAATRAQIPAAAHAVAIQLAARIQRQPVFAEHDEAFAGSQFRHQPPPGIAGLLGRHRVTGRHGRAAPGIGLIAQTGTHHRIVNGGQVQRDAAPCHQRQRCPQPQPAGTMQIVVALMRTTLPADAPGGRPALPRGGRGLTRSGPGRQREPRADESIERPRQGDDAEQQLADTLEQKGRVDPMQERHQIAQPFPQIAPAALAQNGAGVRVDEDLVQHRRARALLVQPDRERHAAAVLSAERRGGHRRGWRESGYVFPQGQRVQPRGIRRRRRHAMQGRRGGGVQRVVPRQRDAGQRHQAKKAGQHQAGPAMQPQQRGAHVHQR